MTNHPLVPLLLLASLAACASPPVKAPKPAPPPPPTTAERLAKLGLPELPFDPDQASQDFRRGTERALRFLDGEGPAPAQGADQAAFEAFLKQDLMDWLTASASELDGMQRAFAPVAEGDDGEASVAAALVGLAWSHVHGHFVGLPAPPVVEGDAQAIEAYRDSLGHASIEWLQQAAGTFAFCAQRAEQSGDERLSPWATYCGERRDALAAQMQAMREKVRRALDAQAEAARGPRPAGSEVCWTPSQGRGPAPQSHEPKTPVPAIAMLDVVEASRVPLLSDERAKVLGALTEKLAAAYAEKDVQVAWLEGDELTAEWKRGRQVTGGKTCARPVELVAFLRTSYPNLELAHAWSHCNEGTCTLHVDLGDHAVASVLGHRRLTAPLKTPLSDVQHWIDAVGALAPVTEADPKALMNALQGRWRASPGETLTLHRFELHGAWQDPAAARLAIEDAGLEACVVPDTGVSPDQMRVLEVAPSGSVSDLWRPASQKTAQKLEQCVDRALRKVRFGAAEGERRLGLTLALGKGQSRSARDAAYGAIDLATGVRVSVASADNLTLSPAPLHDPATQAGLAACVAQHATEETSTLELRVSAEVSGTGKPRKAAVETLESSQAKPSRALERCLSRALSKARFDCTADGKPSGVEATVCLLREPPQPEAAEAAAAEPASPPAPPPAQAAPEAAAAPAAPKPAGAPEPAASSRPAATPDATTPPAQPAPSPPAPAAK